MEDTVAMVCLEEEMLIYCILPMCSRIAGKRIEQDVIIQDMKGFGVGKLMDKSVRDWCKALAKAAQDNYPELLGTTIVTNAPFILNAAWAVMKTFLDKKTRKKIQILGSDYQKKLYEIVNRDAQPDFLGGSVSGVYPKMNAPWKDYLPYCMNQRKSWFSSDEIYYISDPYLRGKQMDLEESEKEKKNQEMSLINETKLVEITMMSNGMNDKSNCMMEVYKKKYSEVNYDVDENTDRINIVNSSTFTQEKSGFQPYRSPQIQTSVDTDEYIEYRNQIYFPQFMVKKKNEN